MEQIRLNNKVAKQKKSITTMKYAVFTVDVEKPYKDGELGVFEYLRIFRTFEIKATFFITGDVAEKNPAVVKAIMAEDHEVASHGWRHSYIGQQGDKRMPPLTFLCAADLEREIRYSKQVLKDLGANPIGFRAPWFQTNGAVLKAVGKYYKYDSSLTTKEMQNIKLPDGLKELPVSTFRWLGLKVGTFVCLNRIPSFILKKIIPHTNIDPLTLYGHSFDFITCNERLDTSKIKKLLYFDRCGPIQTKEVKKMIALISEMGVRFITGAEAFRFE